MRSICGFKITGAKTTDTSLPLISANLEIHTMRPIGQKGDKNGVA